MSQDIENKNKTCAAALASDQDLRGPKSRDLADENPPGTVT